MKNSLTGSKIQQWGGGQWGQNALESRVFEGIKSRWIQTSQFVQTGTNGGKMNNTASGIGPNTG